MAVSPMPPTPRRIVAAHPVKNTLFKMLHKRGNHNFLQLKKDKAEWNSKEKAHGGGNVRVEMIRDLSHV